MDTPPCPRGLASEAGSSLIETALVSIFLLMLMASVVDLGRAFRVYIVITSAAEQGARYAARAPSRVDAIRAVVKEESRDDGILLSDEQILIIPNPATQPIRAGDPIRVEVHTTMPTIMGSMFGLRGLPIHSAAVMMALDASR